MRNKPNVRLLPIAWLITRRVWQLKFIGFAVGVIICGIVFNSYVLIRGFDPAPTKCFNLVMGLIAGPRRRSS